MAREPTWSLLLFGLALCLSKLVGAISPISVKGTKLYDNNGNQFFVKGVAYSRGAASMADPLADNDQCQIDAGLMKTLGVNTIRVYTVDNTLSHDACMQTFASQGIYVWVDLATPLHSVNRVDPEWTTDLYQTYTATIDAFAKYDNLLSFGIGNEIINDYNASTLAAPVIKAATRDIKAFRNARGYRPIPISYSAADVLSYRVLTADYLACGDQDDAIDMYGMNVYSWCGNSSFYTAGFDKLYEQFQHLSIPVLFSETGCKKSSTRDFAEVATMLGPIYQAIFSGAIVYEWTMEANGYGIVKYSGSSATGFPGTLDDFNALKTVYSSVNPTGTAKTEYTPSNSPPTCPTSVSSWPVNPSAALPTIAGLRVDTVTARTTIAGQTGQPQGAGGASQTGSSNSTSPGGSAGGTGSTGVPAGTIAGIVIGCVVVLLLAAAGAFFIIRKRHARRHELSEKGGLAAGLGAGGNGSQQGFKAELPAQAVGIVQRRQEMDAFQQPKYGGIPGDQDGGDELSPYAKARQSHPYEMEGSVPAISELPPSSENHTEAHN